MATGLIDLGLIKRRRRSAAELDELLSVVHGLLDQQSGKISIRHLFYLVVSQGAIAKTERGYANLKHQLTRWRRAGLIRWRAFSDSTRWYYGNPGHPGPRAFLEEMIRTYRYNLWEKRDAHVEIWVEKDAIASIVLEAADPWRVQVFQFRGFASLTSLYNAAQTFREKQAEGKEVYVYYFGDHDPSGVAIDPAAVAALRDDFDVGDQLRARRRHRGPDRRVPPADPPDEGNGFAGEGVPGRVRRNRRPAA